MARQASSKPDSGTASTAALGFHTRVHSFGISSFAVCFHPSQQPATENGTENGSSFDIRPADIGKEHADNFLHVQHPDLRADYVLVKPTQYPPRPLHKLTLSYSNPSN